MASLCFWSSIIFPGGGVLIIPILLVFGLANIAFCMALSTFFSDSKLANQTGGILLILPIACYMYLISIGVPGFSAQYSNEAGIKELMDESLTKYVYAISWIPIVPACNLLINIIDPPNDNYA